MARRIKYQNFTVNSSNAAESQSVSVTRAATGAAATLYAGATGPTIKANPFTSGTGSPDAVGYFEFFVDAGQYIITVDAGGDDEQSYTVSILDGERTQYAARTDLVADVAAGVTWPDGTIINDGLVGYMASEGATTISDLPGFEPFMVWSPAHFGAVLDGSTDDLAALNAMDAALAVALTLDTAANATASISGVPQRDVTFLGRYAGVSDTWLIEDMQHVRFINGGLKAVGGAWGNENLQLSNVATNFYKPLVKLSGELTETLERDYDIHHVSFDGFRFDGADKASLIGLLNTYHTVLRNCTGLNWPAVSGVTSGYGVYTPEGKAGYKNGALRIEGCNFSKRHIAATPDNDGGDGYAVIIQTADAMVSGLISYASDYCFYFDRTTNGQLVMGHPFAKGGSDQKSVYIGSDCAGMRITNYYNDTANFEFHSFEHTLTSARFSGGANSTLELHAHQVGENCTGLNLSDLDLAANIVFDETDGTFSDNLNWNVGNIWYNGAPAVGAGGRLMLQRGTASFPSQVYSDRSARDSVGWYSPQADAVAWGGDGSTYVTVSDTGLDLTARGGVSAPRLTFGGDGAGWYSGAAGEWTFTDGTNDVATLDADGLHFGGSAAAIDAFAKTTHALTLIDQSGNTSSTTATAYYVQIADLVTLHVRSLNNIDTTGMVAGDQVQITLPVRTSATASKRTFAQVCAQNLAYSGTGLWFETIANEKAAKLISTGTGPFVNITWGDLTSGVSDIMGFKLEYRT